MTHEDVLSMIETVNDQGRGLTPWEVGYMESLTDWVDRWRNINGSTARILERIYANKTP